MRRQTLKTAILVGVVVLLGLAAVAERVRDRMLEPQPLLHQTASRPRLVARECPHCPALRFERIKGEWAMVAPYRAAAAQDAVARLIAIARAPARHRYDAARFDAARIGLAPPFATLTLDRTRLEFGTTDAISGKRYVRHGAEVALVQDNFSQWLTAAAESFVDPRPFADLTGLARVAEDEQLWPDARVAALAGARASAVTAATQAMEGRALVITGRDGAEHRCRLNRAGARWILVREDLGLAYAIDDPALLAALGAGA
jgi:hypothetical protein